MPEQGSTYQTCRIDRELVTRATARIGNRRAPVYAPRRVAMDKTGREDDMATLLAKNADIVVTMDGKRR